MKKVIHKTVGKSKKKTQCGVDTENISIAWNKVTCKKCLKFKKKLKRPGAPLKYKPEYVEQFKKMAMLGLTNVQMADIIGVTEKTIIQWQKDYPKLGKSIKEGKEFSDENVVASMYRKATGYTRNVKKPMVISDGKLHGSHVEIVEYEEEVISSDTAGIFWLCNRQPDKWKRKIENINKNMTVDGVDIEIED